MAKYRFENFNVELVDATIESVKPTYTIGSDTVNITATLNANGNKLFNVQLGQMPNTDTWGDKEVLEFATKQLETFLVP